jgi:hypothetical protein
MNSDDLLLGMSAFALSQVLVGFAFAFSVCAFQFSDQRAVRAGLMFATSALAAHFWLLDLHTAAVAAAIAGMRFFIAIFWRNNRLFYLFITLVLINAVVTYTGLLTIIASVSTSFATWAAFRHSDREFRVYMMCASALMICHNLLAPSPAAVAFDGFLLISNALAYYRMYFKRRQTLP